MSNGTVAKIQTGSLAVIAMLLSWGLLKVHETGSRLSVLETRAGNIVLAVDRIERKQDLFNTHMMDDERHQPQSVKDNNTYRIVHTELRQEIAALESRLADLISNAIKREVPPKEVRDKLTEIDQRLRDLERKE